MVYQHILHVVYRLQDTRGEWITNRTNTQTIYLVIPYFRLNKISCLHFSNSCGKKYFSVFEIERVKNTRWTIAQMITDELLSEISELIWCTSYDFKDITGWNRIKTHDFILFTFLYSVRFWLFRYGISCRFILNTFDLNHIIFKIWTVT